MAKPGSQDAKSVMIAAYRIKAFMMWLDKMMEKNKAFNSEN
jgi:hypothetical protein